MFVLRRALIALFSMSLLFLSACPLSTNCEGLVYNEALNTCECPVGTMPNYELGVCEGDDGLQIPWNGLPVPYTDGGIGDMAISDAGQDASDVNAPDMTMPDLGIGDVGRVDSGPDAGPAPANAQARFPWNGFTTGSVHVPDGEPIVNHPLRPKFMWEETDGADHYQIQMTRGCLVRDFRTCDFSRLDLDETTDATVFHPEISLPVSMTAPVGARYYWRVRACSVGDVCSDWTMVRYVDVGRDSHDFNGDGYADLAVGAHQQDSPAGYAGSAFVYWGGVGGVNDEPDVSLHNPAGLAFGRFGGVLCGADLNGDGYADLSVSAYSQPTDGHVASGSVYVFFGGPAFGGAVSIAIDNPLGQVNGTFGRALACGGDLDGDGFRELVIGAPHQDLVEENDGAAYVFLGSNAGPVSAPIVLTAPFVEPEIRFARSVETLGDHDGDGFADLIVGTVVVAPSGDRNGGCYVFEGGPTLSEIPATVIERPLDGNSIFCGIIASLSDVNGDGFADIGIGSPGYDSEQEDSGRAHIYLGSATGFSDSPDYSFLNPTSQLIGSYGSIRGLGDINGDGFSDFGIGARGQHFRADMYVGTVDVFLGGVGLLEPAVTFASPTPQSAAFFGNLGRAGDVRGDGYADLVVGSTGLDNPEENEGGAFLYDGGPSGISGTPSTILDNPEDDVRGLFGSLAR